MTLLLALLSHAFGATEDDARKAFDAYVAREAAFDPAIIELFADNATFRTLRDGSAAMSLTTQELAPILQRTLPVAKERGDTNTYDRVLVLAEGDRFRVTAERTSALKCTVDTRFHLVLAPTESGLKIVDLYTETASLSACPPSAELGAALTSVHQALQPMLPLTLDADTRLESVTLRGRAIVYAMRLTSVGPNDVDSQALRGGLAKLAASGVCTDPTLRRLVNLGATVRYTYVFQSGEPVSFYDISSAVCGPA